MKKTLAEELRSYANVLTEADISDIEDENEDEILWTKDNDPNRDLAADIIDAVEAELIPAKNGFNPLDRLVDYYNQLYFAVTKRARAGDKELYSMYTDFGKLVNDLDEDSLYRTTGNTRNVVANLERFLNTWR